MPYDVIHHTQVIRSLLDGGSPFATVTLVAIRGSAPQVLGAKCIVTDQGIVDGTIGGGKIEAAAIARAQEMLSDTKQDCELVKWNLQTDIGMTCGGEVQLFFEVHHRDRWSIAVFGAGHVSQALIPLLTQLDCHVTCVDSRAEWLGKLADHPKLSRLHLAEPKTAVAQLPENAFFVLMSKGHATDLPVLVEILSTRQPPFIGVIGSPQKASVLRRDLGEAGIAPELHSTFHCPVGIPVGNNTPAEISISIVAQLLQVRDRAAGE